MPLFFIGGSSFLLLMVSLLSVLKIYRSEPVFVFVSFSLLYIFLAWVVCGEGNWWVIDYVDSSNVFYGDDENFIPYGDAQEIETLDKDSIKLLKEMQDN